MGRELKRVPMDFNWPLDKVWEGYLNPLYKKCPDCESGSTVARRYLEAIVQLLMIAGEDGRRGRKHPWLSAGLCPIEPPSKDMAELTIGLAGRDMDTFLGHDSCDNWQAVDKIIVAAGLNPRVWGVCPTCKGDAVDPNVKDAYEAWQSFDPPVGDGFQLWSTTTEGHPMSPVFATLDELCAWAESNATTFASSKTTAGEWKRMLGEGLVYHQEGNAIFL